MIDNYMKKIKNMLGVKRNKKYTVIAAIAIFTLCFFVFDLGGLLGIVFTSISNLFSNVDGEIKQVVIKSSGFDEEIGGSYQIAKSADWTSSNSATLLYEVKTSLEINDNVRDVVLVLDTSASMGVSEIGQLKEDTKEFISFLLLNSNNRVGIVTFDDTAEILSTLSNDESLLFEKIDNITTGEDRSYYKALLKVEELLSNYQVADNRELIILFVATGYSNVDSPNEIGQYQILKGKYPNSVIYGIDYEIGSVFLDFLVPISDIQIGMDGKKNPLLEAGLNPEYYETFEIIEYINNDYFYVDNVDDIKVSVGSVEIKKENNQQKIIWTANKNVLRTGNNATMEINIKLNEELIKVEGLYPVSSKTSINYNLFGNSKVSEESSETPILKNGYRIKYNPNLPNDCDLDFSLEEIYYAKEMVNLSNEKLECNGWQFKGWEVIDKVEYMNDNTFIMPANNLNVRGKWTELELNKTMEGSVNSATYVATYDYTGNIQTFVAPHTGTYKIEAWGAQGGYGYDATRSRGGYSTGNLKLNKNDVLYIVVGEQGKSATNYVTSNDGGYNGGGATYGSNADDTIWGSGGGATHVATKSGLLTSLMPNDLILVAGAGGGGGWYYTSEYGYRYNTGGEAGGYKGNTGNGEDPGDGGTQNSGGEGRSSNAIAGGFGYGGGTIENHASGGGSGYYGGGTGYTHGSGAGGGSGYIGNSLLTDKTMYCYNCATSTDYSTKTVSTTNVSILPTSNHAKIGNGYVKITFIG